MTIVSDREDINSICLNVLDQLLSKYHISPDQIGRLEVGTETIIDKSKSVKSVLMQLLGKNSNVEGVDTTNACYGGTNALFNCINWLESEYWDGRYAVCIAADIAVYKNGNARPTGGAGAVAILLGRDAPIVFDHVRATHMEHVYDFYKPDLHSEYPIVDGPLSNKCYTSAVDRCYNLYVEKSGLEVDQLDYVLFHSPYSKLVQKSFGRLAYNDFKRDNAKFGPEFQQFSDLTQDQSINDRNLEKAFMNETKKDFNKKVLPGMLASKNMGNMYCASLYGAICSLISEVPHDELVIIMLN
jgi:hydroxymethylglutaryl-CoA synthase